MPASIALFIKEALAEDKFGHEYNSRIDERVDAMNAAQLQGIYDHLTQTSRTATTDMWRNANKKLIGHVEELMKERVGEVERARAKVQEENAREDAREKLREMRRNENDRMLIAVQENARKQATEEIWDKEKLRRREERRELVLINARLDEEKDKFFLYLGVFYAVSSVLIIVVFSLDFMATALNGLNGAIIGGWMGISTIVCGVLAYRKEKASTIHPKEVTDEDVEGMIEEREEEIRDKTLQEMAAQKRIFKLAMKREKEERKERKRKAQEKAAYEAKLMEDLAREQAEAAAEVFGEAFSQSLDGGSSLASESQIGEDKEERKEESGDALKVREEEEEEEDKEDDKVALLGLPWVAEAGERRLKVEVRTLSATINVAERLPRGQNGTVQAKAAAYALTLGRGGLEGGGGPGGGGEKPFWMCTSETTSVTHPPPAPVGEEKSSDKSRDEKNSELYFALPGAAGCEPGVISLGAKGRIKIEVTATPALGDVELGSGPAVLLGVFEFSLNDVMQAWTKDNRDGGAQSSSQLQESLPLSGVLLDESFETLGSATVTLKLHTSASDDELEAQQKDAEVEDEEDDDSDRQDSEGDWEALDHEEEEEEEEEEENETK